MAWFGWTVALPAIWYVRCRSYFICIHSTHQLIDMFYYVTILRLLLIYTSFFFYFFFFILLFIRSHFNFFSFYRIWCTVIRLILDAVIFLYNRFDGMFYFSVIFFYSFSIFFVRLRPNLGVLHVLLLLLLLLFKYVFVSVTYIDFHVSR